MRWVGHVELMEGHGACTGFWWRKLRERDYLGDLGVDGRVILRWIFWKLVVGAWTGSTWHMIRTDGGTCECGNEPWVSTKCGEFLD